ncbi:hypothetical protein CN187_30595 [Sinorhizobium meliloti]|nr:hypothetical protein CN187_30595 [Sinorhizobium meliloti]
MLALGLAVFSLPQQGGRHRRATPQGRRVRLLIRQGLGIKLTVEAVDKGNNYAEARRGRSEQD